MRRRPLSYPLLNIAMRSGGRKIVAFPTPPVGTQADLSAWYDASKINLPDNTAMDNWSDISGNNLTLLATPGARPRYFSLRTAGMPALEFTGSQTLTGVTGIYTPIQTIYIAYSKKAGANGTFISSTIGAKQLQRDNAVWPNENNPNVLLSSNLSSHNVLRLDYNFATDVYQAYLSKTLVGSLTGTLIDQNLIGNLLIGNRGSNVEFLNADIHEILYYKRTMTAGESSTIEDYLQKKWGFLTVNPEFNGNQGVSNWTPYVNGGTGQVPTLTYDATQGGEAKIDFVGTYAQAGINSSAPIQFEAGAVYRLYWDARSVNPTTMNIYVENPNNNSAGGFAVTATKSTNFFEFTTPLAGGGRVYLRTSDTMVANPTLWLDNIYLRKLN